MIHFILGWFILVLGRSLDPTESPRLLLPAT